MDWSGGPKTGLVADLVDAFLAAPKRVAAEAAWQQGNRPAEFRALWPILVEDSLVGASMQATAIPNSPEPQFTITLNIPDCVWRLDFEPSWKRHANPMWAAPALGDFVVNGPHFHAWADNSSMASLTQVPELLCARALPATVKTWKQALRWFCAETRIELAKTQMIEYPPREGLI
ncbi:hypothetical protein FRZ44_14170 [Hypericibacter terrae]|uniref:Uncharacterized protein n=1 Tax=Hypericibacter terrae TaxID=2602015 RepID=A0A5J6MHV7_9PROT|nr:hypothetical protein [Hypericibacter terrae]QEX16125.1 hypothetical protein FRZ44_14170 [Hypericibacter terrae]